MLLCLSVCFFSFIWVHFVSLSARLVFLSLRDLLVRANLKLKKNFSLLQRFHFFKHFNWKNEAKRKFDSSIWKSKPDVAKIKYEFWRHSKKGILNKIFFVCLFIWVIFVNVRLDSDFIMYSRLSRSFTARGFSSRDPTKGITGLLRYHELHASSRIQSTGREVATAFEHCRRFTPPPKPPRLDFKLFYFRLIFEKLTFSPWVKLKIWNLTNVLIPPWRGDSHKFRALIHSKIGCLDLRNL